MDSVSPRWELNGSVYLHSVATGCNDTHARDSKHTALESGDRRIVIAVEVPNFVVSLVVSSVLEDFVTIGDADGVRDI